MAEVTVKPYFRTVDHESADAIGPAVHYWRMNLRMMAAIAATFFVTASWADIPQAQRAAQVSADTPVTPNASPSSGCNCHALDRDDLDAWLDGLLPYALKNGDIAGGVVSVVKDGSVLLQKGYGLADVANHVAMDATTLTRVGSTSKLFTWTAVMQLVEAGKLDLNRDVNDYLDFKIPTAAGKPITLLDLMNHRAGFEEGLKDVLATDPHNLQSTETYLKRHPRPLLFPPGSVPAYSNYGAALAGYIVERVSGEPFERYIEHHIFAPLGMSNSTFEQPLPERFKGHVSLGYRTGSTPAQPYELVVTAPAGSMATTAADMTRFMIAHLENGRLGDAQILSPQTIRLMHSPSESALPGFSKMAHGFFYESRNGHIVIGHGGDTVFFHTELDLLPEQHVGVFYSFNSRGRDEAVYALRKELWDGFMARYFPNASAATADAAAVSTASSDAQQIAGRYQSSRRIEHGFLSIFYLLQQSVITAHADGTIAAPRSAEAGEDSLLEIAPNMWRVVGGTRQLALQQIGGVKTVVDSEDPISVLQAVPLAQSAPLNLTILLSALVILVVTVIAWPTSWLVRRSRGKQASDSTALRRLKLLTRTAAVIDLLYLAAWMMLLKPVLSLSLEVYSTALDPVVRILQFSGLLAIAAAAVGIFSVWRIYALPVSRLYKIWIGLLAAAMLGVVWIGWLGSLLSFNLNY
jgi:CubicO group peptidase (beta-lactamase class C family)